MLLIAWLYAYTLIGDTDTHWLISPHMLTKAQLTHKLVPGGMKFDFINALTKAVVSAQDWWIFVGLKSPTDRLFGACELPELSCQRRSPSSAISLQGRAEGGIGLEKIVAG